MRTHAYAAPGGTGPLWSVWVPMMCSLSSPTGFVIFVAETFMPMVLHTRIVPLWSAPGALFRNPSSMLPMAPHVRRVAPPRRFLWAWEIGRPEVYQWTLEC